MKKALLLILAAAVSWVAANGAGMAQDGEDEAPEAPYDLRAKTRYEGAMAVAELDWRDRADNELGFEILRSNDAGKNFKVVGMVGANTTHYEDKVGKYVSGAFQYKVRAFNEHGKSEPSNMASVWF